MLKFILKYCLFLIALLSGCVDNLPVAIDASTIKYFVVCEMIPGENIIATVNLTGNTSGKLPDDLPHPDELILSIREGNKDFAVNFKYDEDSEIFIIPKEKLNLRIGENYKIQEESGAFFNQDNDIKLQIPSTVSIEKVEIISKTITPQSNGKILTSIKSKIKLSNTLNQKSYLSIVPKTTTENPWTINKVEAPVGSYLIQYHQPGVLIDYDILGNDIIVDMSYISNLAQEDVKITVYNTTRAYYYYNTYMSNNYGQIDQSISSNPAIAAEGLNIRTTQALGSFSALVPTSILVHIK